MWTSYQKFWTSENSHCWAIYIWLNKFFFEINFSQDLRNTFPLALKLTLREGRLLCSYVIVLHLNWEKIWLTKELYFLLSIHAIYLWQKWNKNLISLSSFMSISRESEAEKECVLTPRLEIPSGRQWVRGKSCWTGFPHTSPSPESFQRILHTKRTGLNVSISGGHKITQRGVPTYY